MTAFIGRREFITLLGGRRRRGRSRRARSSRADAAHRVLWPRARPECKPAATPSSGPAELGWSRAVTSRSNIDGRWTIPTDCAESRPNWSRSGSMSSLAGNASAGARRSRQPRSCRSCSQSMDPVGTGLSPALARPGGNVTGFVKFEYGMSGKWLELLKRGCTARDAGGVVRNVANPYRVATVRRDPGRGAAIGLEFDAHHARPSDIERAFTVLRARREWRPDRRWSGRTANSTRYSIAALAAQHRLPAVYPSARRCRRRAV